MNLRTLRVLADNGQSLDITNEPVEGGVMIQRKGFIPVTHLASDPLESLRSHLRYYPRPVRIDGQELMTRQAPNRSMVRVLTPLEMDIAEQEPQPLPMGPLIQSGLHNAIAGGVLIRIQTGRSPSGHGQKWRTSRYVSLMEGQTRHRSMLQIVELQTLMEIHSSELGQLHQGRHGIEIPRGFALDHEVWLRIRRTEERTISIAEMPPLYQGKVHRAALVSDEGDSSYIKPAPIAVSGTPVVITSGFQTGGEFVSITQALYDADTELVPVSGSEDPENYIRTEKTSGEPEEIVSAKFTFIPEEPDRLAMVDSITLSVQTRSGRTLEVPARFHLSGGWSNRISARAVRGATTQDEMLEAMMRAFWLCQDWESNQDEDERRDQFTQEMENLVSHLFGRSQQATRHELERIITRLSTDLPRPQEPVSITSRDGAITITMNPETPWQQVNHDIGR